jgi:hypothetical protein
MCIMIASVRDRILNGSNSGSFVARKDSLPGRNGHFSLCVLRDLLTRFLISKAIDQSID